MTADRRGRAWPRLATWLGPKRILIILATVVAVLALAACGPVVDVLAPAGFTSADTNWLIAGSTAAAA